MPASKSGLAYESCKYVLILVSFAEHNTDFLRFVDVFVYSLGWSTFHIVPLQSTLSSGRTTSTATSKVISMC